MLSLINMMHILIFFFSLLKIMISEKMIFMLMSMEMTMLSVFFLFYDINKSWFMNPISITIFLSFMVCESVLGLGLYIYITRMAGNDEFKSMNLLK